MTFSPSRPARVTVSPGTTPGMPVHPAMPALEPVMSLRATVAMVKEARAGDTFSYGRLYTAPGPRTIATVAIGYADGYPRCMWLQLLPGEGLCLLPQFIRHGKVGEGTGAPQSRDGQDIPRLPQAPFLPGAQPQAAHAGVHQ